MTSNHFQKNTADKIEKNANNCTALKDKKNTDGFFILSDVHIAISKFMAVSALGLGLVACGGSGSESSSVATNESAVNTASTENVLISEVALCSQSDAESDTNCLTKNEAPANEGGEQVYSGNYQKIPLIELQSGINKWLTNITVPVYGNTYLDKDLATQDRFGKLLTPNGLRNWTRNDGSINTYVRVPSRGGLSISLDASVPAGESTLIVSINGTEKIVPISGNEITTIPVGNFDIAAAGYIKISIKAKSNSNSVIADINNIRIGGPAVTPGVAADVSLATDSAYFVDNDYYWGMRGSSTHMTYITDNINNIEWFYNEVTVPVGFDPIGTYAMVNGFNSGYGGIQVNSDSERRVLFSVWSPYATDDPKSIPENQKVKVISKGEQTYSGEFGNEGSGGQTYVKFNWKAGLTYKTLLRAQPLPDTNATDFSMFFYDPESKKWNFIATLRRPNTQTNLSNLYSFLENFKTFTGAQTRQAQFDNQWVKTSAGAWVALTKAEFTNDPTGDSRRRLDKFGAVIDNKFSLKINGFFNDFTKSNTIYQRVPSGKNPEGDLLLALQSLPNYKAPTPVQVSRQCPNWSSTLSYNKDSKITFENKNYTSKWWTRNEQPGQQWGPWILSDSGC